MHRPTLCAVVLLSLAFAFFVISATGRPAPSPRPVIITSHPAQAPRTETIKWQPNQEPEDDYAYCEWWPTADECRGRAAVPPPHT